MRHLIRATYLATSLSLAALSSPSFAEPAPNDAQIMKIAGVANEGEIAAAKLAITRAKNKEVKSFAKMMISDHTEVIKKADALGLKLHVTPEPSSVSHDLEASNQAAADHLKPLQDDAFDRLYIDQQVTAHQTVLDSLDKTLIPEAKNPELKGLLQSVRPKVAAHLGQAKKIQSALAAKPS